MEAVAERGPVASARARSAQQVDRRCLESITRCPHHPHLHGGGGRGGCGWVGVAGPTSGRWRHAIRPPLGRGGETDTRPLAHPHLALRPRPRPLPPPYPPLRPAPSVTPPVLAIGHERARRRAALGDDADTLWRSYPMPTILSLGWRMPALLESSLPGQALSARPRDQSVGLGGAVRDYGGLGEGLCSALPTLYRS